ncbi:uncharacterized protein LY79DRAFT_593547 [Colletotrichum navitas]|uniref:Uncharacterized protein n=1 Tax=Colletotrichum navitas TaxID=681940 RepID=A0AAD8PPX3_9PEZI|nr:uncharacterized protein LY79DRAFT_593547 [Colletotrichum navitas]KAK1574067.1 hypothetical protein LY79DRAFT_593547 [Colletotrichum navitas]
MHLLTLGRLAILLAPALVLALPTPKDAKFFNPSDDPFVTDLGKKTGRIGIDIVDPSALRVDPVRVFENIARSPSETAWLTKRRDAAPLEEREKEESAAAGTAMDEGKEDIRASRRAHVQVDPVEVDVPVVRPSPMVMPAHARQPQDTGPTGDMPKFRPVYDVGEWCYLAGLSLSQTFGIVRGWRGGA